MSDDYEADHCGTEDELYLPSSPKSRGASVTVPNLVNLVAPNLDGQIDSQSDLRTPVVPPGSSNQPIVLDSDDESPSTPKSEAETMNIDINNLPLDFSKIEDEEKTKLSIALEQKIQTLPIDCPASFRFRLSLAQLYISQERFAAASKIHRKSIDILSRTGHTFSKAISNSSFLWRYDNFLGLEDGETLVELCLSIIKLAKAAGLMLSLELEQLASTAIKRIQVVPVGRVTGKVVYGYLLWCHHHQLRKEWVEAYKILSHARDTYQLVCRLGFYPRNSNQQEIIK